MIQQGVLRRLSSMLAMGSLGGTLAGCASSSVPPQNKDSQAAPPTISITLNPVPGHAALAIGSWAPWTTEVSKTLPASLHNVPTHSSEALFGEFSFGDGTRYRVAGTQVGFMLDEANERFIADENRNGDLTDDAPASWTVERRPSRDGRETYGTVTVRAEIASGVRYDASSFSVALFFADAQTRAKLGEPIRLDRYRDYATEGVAQLGPKAFQMLLDDSAVTGDFSASLAAPRSDITIRIDVNGNGIYENRGEAFDADQLFSVGGVTYQVAGISKDGTRVELVTVDTPTAEVLPPPDLRVGNLFPSFSAITSEGERIDFPSSFKGKIVLLDFWASWCGPCIREIPHLKQAFTEFHAQGLEIVSISIDEEKSRQKAQEVIVSEKMDWLHVFDTGGWEGDLVARVSPGGIPAAYLVDGDTGRVLASLQQLRGAQLKAKLMQVLRSREQQPSEKE